MSGHGYGPKLVKAVTVKAPWRELTAGKALNLLRWWLPCLWVMEGASFGCILEVFCLPCQQWALGVRSCFLDNHRRVLQAINKHKMSSSWRQLDGRVPLCPCISVVAVPCHVLAGISKPIPLEALNWIGFFFNSSLRQKSNLCLPQQNDSE